MSPFGEKIIFSEERTAGRAGGGEGELTERSACRRTTYSRPQFFFASPWFCVRGGRRKREGGAVECGASEKEIHKRRYGLLKKHQEGQLIDGGLTKSDKNGV